MKAAAAFGRDLDARLKAVIEVHKDGLAKARAAKDPAAEKFVLDGCQYIDTLVKTTYKLSQEFDTLPAVAAPIKSMSKDAAGRMIEAAMRGLEVRAEKIKGAGPMKILQGSMGALEPLTEDQFYPDGSYDWYNPADWFRAAKFEAYQTLQQAVAGATELEEGVAGAAADAADKAGKVTMKYLALGSLLALGLYAATEEIKKHSKKPQKEFQP